MLSAIGSKLPTALLELLGELLKDDLAVLVAVQLLLYVVWDIDEVVDAKVCEEGLKLQHLILEVRFTLLGVLVL